MKVDIDPRLPIVPPNNPYLTGLSRRLYELFRQISSQVNGISEGSIVASYNADTAAPTTGTYHQGDFIRNSSPTELGTAGSKYTIFGWICTVSGTPGTWVQQRFLTGN
jgi:hypothetical protein